MSNKTMFTCRAIQGLCLSCFSILIASCDKKIDKAPERKAFMPEQKEMDENENRQIAVEVCLRDFLEKHRNDTDLAWIGVDMTSLEGRRSIPQNGVFIVGTWTVAMTSTGYKAEWHGRADAETHYQLFVYMEKREGILTISKWNTEERRLK